MRKHPSIARLAGSASLALAVAWLPAPARAQAVAVSTSPEVRVAEEGDDLSMTMSPGGRIALAWANGDVLARLYRLGAPESEWLPVPQTNVLRVNALASDDLHHPGVAADGRGNFVVVWQSGAPPVSAMGSGDGSGSGIFAQRFRANGVRQGGELRVNSAVAGNQTSPRVAMAPGGNFTVAWEEPDAPAIGIRLARFAANGSRLGRAINLPAPAGVLGGVAAGDAFAAAAWTEARACDTSTDEPASAVVTLGWAGKLRQVSHVTDANPCDGQGPVALGLYGSPFGPLGLFVGHRYTVQRYSPTTGEALGPRPTIAELGSCDAQSCASLAAAAGDGRGRLVVLWEQRTRTADGDQYELWAQLFGRDGKARSPKILATTLPSSAQEAPAAALTDDGWLTVFWKRTSSTAAANGLILRALKMPS